ncbi:Axonemal dynein intermediate chain 1 [Intoshia linei]|uniref:Axonemal dynein intermediate chain 1 n=1 Tax=Intoshia linei TaxID=1819745 RepID=A0A177AZS7_9BILA|nr:Axonemal dynein intermediate chain 1 [Intoshia linei]
MVKQGRKLVGGIASERKKSYRRDDDDMSTLEATEDGWIHGRNTIEKPMNQLQLTEKELKEEHTRILTANNPHAPKNLVQYNYKEQKYILIQNIDQIAHNFSMCGHLLFKSTEEGQDQLKYNERQSEANNVVKADNGQTTETADYDGTKKIHNQFNYNDRASQTYNNPLREHGSQTQQPAKTVIADTVNQANIFDAYEKDFMKQKKTKEKKEKIPKKTNDVKKNYNDNQSEDIGKVAKAATITERMVNQNTYDDVTMDFKYWEDVSDEYRDKQGSLLPLWKFMSEKSKKMVVTSIQWHPVYNDLFGASFGSFEFRKDTKGMFMFFSLKNPSYPDYTFETNVGIMSFNIHPENHSLVVLGMADGTVGVIDVTKLNENFLYKSSATNGKHSDPVWEVRWTNDNNATNLNFYSVSSDSRVSKWVMIKDEIEYRDVIQLPINEPQEEKTIKSEKKIDIRDGGFTFDFHPQKDYKYIVGSRKGKLYLCCKLYSSRFLKIFNAHTMTIYRVTWNKYNTDLFITCSADWTICIWNQNSTDDEPLFTFDVGASVEDVCWAPYSSTVFAAVTIEGVAIVYDIAVNKYDYICKQTITTKKKTKLTKISFNPVYPIIIVGDDRGHISCLKLSPNLRIRMKEKKTLEVQKPEEKLAERYEYEKNKLEKILSNMRKNDKK